MEVRGVQKTDEPKKTFQTDLTDAKILAGFRFGLILVLLYKKPKISVRFSVANSNTPNRIEIY